MTNEEIKQGASYVGRKGKTRTVLSIGALETWQRASARLMNNLDCTYTVGDKTRTIRLGAFSGWAVCECEVTG